MQDINGIVILNKPTGMNSMTAVKKVQYFFDAKKAGHLGTLDPYASGVLIVALGKATKNFEKHLTDKKIYRAIFKFGFQTTTFDSEGEITLTDNKTITEQDIKSVLPSMVGEFEQMPPDYSAKKINGKKAYELARQGKKVVLKPKKVEIYKFDLINELQTNTFLFEIECSSGTYIRSCVRDLATKLKTVGVMVGLVRTKTGDKQIEDSVILSELNLNDIREY